MNNNVCFGYRMTSRLAESGSSLHYFFWSVLFLVQLLEAANATTQCYQWAAPAADATVGYPRPFFSDPYTAAQDKATFCTPSKNCDQPYGVNCGATNDCIYTVQAVTLTIWPNYTVTYKLTWTVKPGVIGTGGTTTIGPANITPLLNPFPNGCQSYVSSLFLPQKNCGPWCNGVGHPINPATGAVYDSLLDVSDGASIDLKRFYNSTDAGRVNLSVGWRHGFTRNIKVHFTSGDYRPFVSGPDNSSLFNDEATACTSGFTQIKLRVGSWAKATASYINGSCVVAAGGSVISILPILYNAPPTPAPGTSAINGYDLTRDDGQLIRFIIDGDGAIINPPGINLKLQKTTSGFTVADSNDNVEQYDANGKLLTITSRTGVVQTMNYDGSGRLSSVSDSFGHQLTMNYDGQDRLSSVTRQ